jgi:hypothetical protein
METRPTPYCTRAPEELPPIQKVLVRGRMMTGSGNLVHIERPDGLPNLADQQMTGPNGDSSRSPPSS